MRSQGKAIPRMGKRGAVVDRLLSIEIINSQEAYSHAAY